MTKSVIADGNSIQMPSIHGPIWLEHVCFGVNPWATPNIRIWQRKIEFTTTTQYHDVKVRVLKQASMYCITARSSKVNLLSNGTSSAKCTLVTESLNESLRECGV